MNFTFTGPVSFPIEVSELLAELVKIRNILILTRRDIMATMQELKDAVAENRSVTGSAVTLLNGLTAKIQELIDTGANPAEIQAAIDEVKADTAELAAAVTANTPAETVPPV